MLLGYRVNFFLDLRQILIGRNSLILLLLPGLKLTRLLGLLGLLLLGCLLGKRMLRLKDCRILRLVLLNTRDQTLIFLRVLLLQYRYCSGDLLAADPL